MDGGRQELEVSVLLEQIDLDATRAFRQYLLSFYQTGFEFDRWLNTPGWPPYLPDLSPGDSLMKPAEELAQLWVTKELDMKAIEAVAISTWKTYQLVYFLDKILQKSPLPPGKKAGKSRFLVYRALYQKLEGDWEGSPCNAYP